ncbi:MAG: hypothetical protein J7J25_02810 [Candidatus Omnitrophica bacterium]|nr:hypothetical protein [Candidatus Omnitrophota bacterium]
MANKKLERLESAFFSSYKQKRKKAAPRFFFNSRLIISLLAITLISLIIITIYHKVPYVSRKDNNENVSLSTSNLPDNSALLLYPLKGELYLGDKKIRELPFTFESQKGKTVILRIDFPSPLDMNRKKIRITFDVFSKNTLARAVFRDSLFFSNSNYPYTLTAKKNGESYVLDITPPPGESTINFYKINQIRISFSSSLKAKTIWSINKIEIIKRSS